MQGYGKDKPAVLSVNNVKIYFVGYSDDDSNLDLAKQYKKENERITAEAVDTNNRPDLVEKYGIESGT